MIALLDTAPPQERFSPHAQAVSVSRDGVLALAQPLPRKLGSVSCIVPCYNEAVSLEQLLPQLHETLQACTEQWEVILVDDGSLDATSLVLAKWTQTPGFRALLLSRNFGKEAALMAGLEAAQGDAVVMMDSDLQHSPSLIPVFLQHWCQGRDVVYALREDRHDESSFKRLGTRWFYRLVNMSGRFEVPAGAGDFRLMDRAVVNALLSLPERNRFMKGLYAWVGFDVIAVPYMPSARLHGTTTFSPWRLIRLSLDGLTGFTTWPLRAVSGIGFVLAVFALLYGAYLTLAYFLYGHVVNGWTTLAVSLMGFSGIQLLSLGIVGEYVGKIAEEVKARPLYVIKRELGQGLKKANR
ncbi:glycosyltransferase family 2 protein [Simplicispira psychrophila]|uniref:glycosyltransferase family 2 protein n=1 Tax=Simplicispira psychrophila TaxID=80882 RepID=UPI0009FD8428|nr:glycosyltransferase family 2 protein [Simplicispira psychrophila]